MGGGWGMMSGWLLLWSLLVVVVVLVVLMVRALRSPPGPRSEGTSARPSALEILEERFARGEIDRQEFEERRRSLRS
jgi:putative membrane protein